MGAIEFHRSYIEMSDRPSTAEKSDESISNDHPHTRSAGFTVQFTPARGARRRISYEPRTDADGWWRITHEWTGCAWRIVGREPVFDVHLATDSDV